MKESDPTRLETEPATRRGGRRRRVARRNVASRTHGATLNGRPLERFLKENASGLTFLGVTLGVFISRKFLILPVAVALMLAQEKLGTAGLDRVRDAVRS